MTPEVFPPLPEVQTSIADLVASSNRRFEAGERSKWFMEMTNQMDDFEASGYRCMDILRLDEDNPTEADIDEIVRETVEECDIAVFAAIRELSGAMRRQAKVASDYCPGNGVAYVREVVDGVTKDNPTEKRVSRRLKPEVYGRFGSVIRDSMRLTFNRRKDPSMGEFGLYADDERRPAEPEDVRSWNRLHACWGRSLQFGVQDVYEELCENRDPGLVVLNSLFNMYQTTSGADPEDDVTAQEQLYGGCGTASRSCMRITYAMNAYLIEEKGMKDPKQRAIIIGRSPGPIVSMAGLEDSQQRAFSAAYLGAHIDKSYITDFEKIRTDMLELGKSGRINFVQPIDDLPLPVGLNVGRFGRFVRRIGCPILLTPKLIQGLWGSFVDSAVQAELI